MKIILNLDINDSNNIENIEYILEQHIAQASEISLLIFGKYEELDRLKIEIIKKYNNSLICVLPSLTDDDISLLNIAFMASCGLDRVDVVSIKCNDIVYQKYPDDLDNKTIPYIYSKMHEGIVSASKGWLYQKAYCHLKDMKELSRIIHDTTLSANLNQIAVIMRNIVDVEQEYIFGNDVNNLKDILLQSPKNQFEKNNLLNLATKYSYIHDNYKHYLPQISIRLEQLNLILQLSNDVAIGKHETDLMYWFSAYFLMLATYYKKNCQYYSGILFIIRALECALQGTCFKHGKGCFGRYGKFELNGCPCTGVGELNRFVSGNYLLSSEQILHCVEDVIDIRNKSVIGHGFSYLNEVSYDHCYKKIRSYIDCLASKTFSNANHWKILSAYSQSNILKELGVVIGKSMLSNVVKQIN